VTFFSYKKMYREMHQADPKVFSGRLSIDLADRVAVLVERYRPRSLLDYGSGKGYQYLRDRVQDRWGGLLPICYDPGVIQLEELPDGPFDGVLCTDVLEHIKPGDVDETLGELFARARHFVYMSICCRPAGKLFPDGTNVHLTVEPPEWWETKLRRFQRETGVYAWADYEYQRGVDLQPEGVGAVRPPHGDDVPVELAEGSAADRVRRKLQRTSRAQREGR
jgi:hypothetical protein